ncbi:MAG: OmpA family protein [Prevotella sp.]|jgi:outer membrane protein OmpA-like peptidoglycan-associated protein|nr:OmpA family protein [Prevotella sp.]
MKTRFLLLPIILFWALAISPSMQANSSVDSRDCETARDSVLIQSNSGEDMIAVKRSMQQSSVSRSNMAKRRKAFDCPDILESPVSQAENPEIEVIRPALSEPSVDGKSFFLPDPVFFRINQWKIDQPEWDKIELAVNYLKANPNSTIVVTGYADRKTGNATINMRLSKERSIAVAKALEERFGVSRDRISVNWKGDGLQPFEFDNDKNRTTLFLINP